MKQSMKSRFSAMALALAVLMGILCSLTPSANAAVFVRDSRTSSVGPCLDAHGAAASAGTPIQNWTCNAGVAQHWLFEGLQIVGIGSNATTGFNCIWTTRYPAVGVAVVLAPCTDPPGEFAENRWVYSNNQIQTYISVNGYRLCIDASGVIGTSATLQSCNGTPGQTWAIR